MSSDISTFGLGWNELNGILNKRKLIFWGRGEWMEKSIPYLEKAASYVIDNNEYEQGQIEHGIEIHGPKVLENENLDEIFIIITTSGFPEVEAQIQKMGIKPGVHYTISPSLKNFRVLSRIKNHNAEVLFTCSDRPNDDPQLGGGLYSLSLKSNKRQKIINGTCHGLHITGEMIVLVDDSVGIRLLTTDYETIKTIALPPKSRPHGIAYDPDRNLIFVNFSGFDAIGVVNLDTGELLRTISLSEKYSRKKLPQHHLNDICVL